MVHSKESPRINLQIAAGKIPYKLVLAILDRHNLSGGLELMVPPFQLTSLLHDVYFACEKLGHFNQDANYKLDRATGLLANFFWNVYDPWVEFLAS